MTTLRQQQRQTVQTSLLCLCLLAGHLVPGVSAARKSCETVQETFSQLVVVDENGDFTGASGEIYSELTAAEGERRGAKWVASPSASSYVPGLVRVFQI